MGFGLEFAYFKEKRLIPNFIQKEPSTMKKMMLSSRLRATLGLMLCCGLLFLFPACDTPSVVEQPPVGNIFSPITGNAVGRSVRIGVVAQAQTTADDNKVEKVQVAISGFGVDTQVGEATRVSASGKPMYEYLWDSTKLADGTYYVQAEITDSRGNRAVTEKQTITVENGANNGPRIDIVNVAAGEQVSGTKVVEVKPREGEPAVQGVALMLNGVQVGAMIFDTFKAAYVYSLDTRNLRPGMHMLQARSKGTSGNLRFSPEMVINVTGG